MIAQLDAVVYPGMHDRFVELVQPAVRSLPAFASGDFDLVDEQLEPHAGLLREVVLCSPPGRSPSSYRALRFSGRGRYARPLAVQLFGSAG